MIHTFSSQINLKYLNENMCAIVMRKDRESVGIGEGERVGGMGDKLIKNS